MTKITYKQLATPTGTVVIDTEHLLISTSGRVFMRDSSDGRLVPLSAEQLAEVGKHFGPLLGDACVAVRGLS